jgi:HD-GYP domain-containing protein (c-di-GMP phosphodiesterase class II)
MPTRRIDLGIRSQLTALIITIIIISVTVPTYIISKDAEKQMYADIEARAALIINYMHGAAKEPLINNDELKLSEYASKVRQTEGIIYVIITDDKGYVRGSADRQDHKGPSGEPRLVKEVIAGAHDETGPAVITYRGKEARVFNYADAINIKRNGADVAVGKIYLGFDRNATEGLVARFYIKSAAVALLIIMLSVFMMTSITGMIMKPLHQIIEGTEIIAAGDMRHKIKVKVKNEFQALANSFNSMTERLNNYYDGVLNAFIVTMDTIDKYTPGHAKRVAKYSTELAREAGLSFKQIENVRLASILKDVGNIGVQRNILSKTEALTADDYIEIQKHPEVSAKILEHIDALKEVLPIILQHHERFDGNGYPKGLKAGEICAEARILAIADAYDAMMTKRGHREAVTPEEAVYELRLNRGMQFDPKLTDTFIMMIHRKGGI